MRISHDERVSIINREYRSLVGRTIKKVRPLYDQECEAIGWDYNTNAYAFVIILDDNTALIPSADAEGNGQGHIFVEQMEKQ